MGGVTRRVVVDARPMQSASSADRGIGRYTVDCFRALERLDPGLVDAYVIDPELPLHRNLEPFGNAGKLLRSDRWEGPPPAVFHITSLWETVEQERLLPRWVEPGTTRLVMTVFDLIPMLFPETYLADPLVRVGYEVKLSTLRLADRIATISRTSAEDVVRLASLPAGIVVPVMGGVSEIFRPSSLDVPTLRARIAERFPEVGASPYVLAPLGIEPRKNVEPLIEAYSSLPDPLAERHPLVVQCAVAPEQAARLHEVHRAAGGRGRLVLTGFVAEEDLVLLYQGAELVVFPSRYEGLGLPVLEARSCGAAVICGDNSALREVQPDEAGRFDVGSVESIARALGDALEDPDLRARLRSRPVEHEFTWEHTASEVAGIYRELLATTRRPSVPRRARLGLATPVPPDTAGPAIYAGRLIPHLAELVDLTVLTNDQHELDGVRAQPLSDLHVAERIERPFDRVLYMLGNSERHISCEFFHRVVRPGAVLFHDARLVGLYREMARARPELLPDPAGLLPTLHGMYPGRYRPWVPEEEGDGLDQELVTRLGILMAEAVVRTAADAGEALLVHSEHQPT
jgi:glycosyltransferase involved in cell wall biosynthesis